MAIVIGMFRGIVIVILGFIAFLLGQIYVQAIEIVEWLKSVHLRLVEGNAHAKRRSTQ